MFVAFDFLKSKLYIYVCCSVALVFLKSKLCIYKFNSITLLFWKVSYIFMFVMVSP